MDRLKTAVGIPLVVFPAAAVAAVAIGMLLLYLPRPVAPWVALVMVIAATAAGFIASSRADSPRI